MNTKNIKNQVIKVRVPDLFILILFFILAFTVRVWSLSKNSLWNDEFWTIFFSSGRQVKNIAEMFYLVATRPAENPPFYLVIMRGWIKVFGDGEELLRYPSVIFGSLSVPFFYIFLKKLLSRRLAVIASLLLVFSPVHIHYSQEVTKYILFFFLSLSSMYFFYLRIRKPNKINMIGYICSNVLLLYTHYYSFFLIFGQLLTILTISRKRKGWILSFISPFLFYIPWIYVLVNHSYSTIFIGSWIGKINIWDGLISELSFFSSHLEFFPLQMVNIILFLIGVLNVCTFIRGKKKILFYTLIFWLIVPILPPLVLSQFFKPFFVNRFALISLAPFIIFMSLGIEIFIRRSKLLLIPFILLLYLTFKSNQLDLPQVSIENWRTVISYLVGASKNPVILYPDTPATKMGLEYYSEGKQIRLIPYKDLNVTSENCFQKIYLLSRFRINDLNSKCNYNKIKTYFSETPPYLYEYQSSSDLQNIKNN